MRRSNCTNTASGIVTLCRWPSCAPDGHQQIIEEYNKLCYKTRICALSWSIAKIMPEMHGQQNIKICLNNILDNRKINMEKWDTTDLANLKCDEREHYTSRPMSQRCWQLCTSCSDVPNGKNTWRRKNWTQTEFFFPFHSTPGAVVSEKNITLQNKHYCMQKRIFSYVMLTVDWNKQCGPFMAP
jgi:hypothetical protein